MISFNVRRATCDVHYLPYFLIIPVLICSLFCGVAVSSAQGAETVCLQCHGGLGGPLGEPVAAWRGSIHAGNGISCHHCHGGDPSDAAMAMSPERGFIGVPADERIPNFCGRCHVGVEKDYLDSAHGRALGSGGPQCVTCHDSHAIRKASPELINRESCTRCHDYGRADEIKIAITETDGRISAQEAAVQVLHGKGVTVKDLRDRLFSLRNDFHRLFHSVDVEKVRRQTAAFSGELAKTDQEIEAIRAEHRQRRLWGGAVVLLLIVGCIAAFLLHRSYMEER